MLLLIDENVPRSVSEFFEQRGHETLYVRDELLPGTPDAIVATLGDRLDAVLVTWNRRDVVKLAPRIARGRVRFRRLGHITFRCNEAQGRRRAEQLIESIEFEYAQAKKRPDKRLMVEILKDSFRVYA